MVKINEVECGLRTNLLFIAIGKLITSASFFELFPILWKKYFILAYRHFFDDDDEPEDEIRRNKEDEQNILFIEDWIKRSKVERGWSMLLYCVLIFNLVSTYTSFIKLCILWSEGVDYIEFQSCVVRYSYEVDVMLKTMTSMTIIDRLEYHMNFPEFIKILFVPGWIITILNIACVTFAITFAIIGVSVFILFIILDKISKSLTEFLKYNKIGNSISYLTITYLILVMVNYSWTLQHGNRDELTDYNFVDILISI